VILTGATGLVGRHLLPLLLMEGLHVQAISRRPPLETSASTLEWLAADLSREPGESRPSRGLPAESRAKAISGCAPGALKSAKYLFHTAPLWLLPACLHGWADLGVRRVVALSSTSRSTKAGSIDSEERDLARRLEQAEEKVEAICRLQRIHYTLLRPTLVYDGERDRNVSDIARFVRRFRFFPIAGRGVGRRQPLHADDLAAACLAVHDNPATFGRTYETPGGETLTFAEMVSRVARGAGLSPRLLHLPPPLLRRTLAVARRLPGLSHLSPGMADRMNEDLVFDASAAQRDFGYAPRSFRYPVAQD
jgi:uncharacterized protein YbjT (DUF2867 family)